MMAMSKVSKDVNEYLNRYSNISYGYSNNIRIFDGKRHNLPTVTPLLTRKT